LALAGLFFSAGVEEAEAARVINIIVSAAPTSSFERISQVAANVGDTYAAGAAGMAITGVPALKELIDPLVVDVFLEWSGLWESIGSTRRERQSSGKVRTVKSRRGRASRSRRGLGTHPV
jgi:hypothetical protein